VIYSLSALDPAGTFARVRTYRGPVGKVLVTWKPPTLFRLRRLVVGIETGGGRAGFFDVAAAAETALELPAGTYSLAWGELAARYGDARVELFRGEGKAIVVRPGRPAEIALGGPYRVEIPVGLSGVEGEVRTWEMRIFGKAGEGYRRFFGRTPSGEFKVLDRKGRLVHEGKLEPHPPDEELPETPAGLAILEFPRPVRFTSSVAAPELPVRLEAKGWLPVLGPFETEGWKK
jgi:hypothetical protein